MYGGQLSGRKGPPAKLTILVAPSSAGNIIGLAVPRNIDLRLRFWGPDARVAWFLFLAVFEVRSNPSIQKGNRRNEAQRRPFILTTKLLLLRLGESEWFRNAYRDSRKPEVLPLEIKRTTSYLSRLK